MADIFTAVFDAMRARAAEAAPVVQGKWRPSGFGTGAAPVRRAAASPPPLAERFAAMMAGGVEPMGAPVVSEHSLDGALGALVQGAPERMARSLLSPRERAARDLGEQQRAEEQARADAEAAAAAAAAAEQAEEPVEPAAFDWDLFYEDQGKSLDDVLDAVALEDAVERLGSDEPLSEDDFNFWRSA